MIRDDIKAATIAAMKSGDKDTTGTLRLVQAAIKNRDIEARTGGAPKDDDALVTEVLQKMVKQRRESADIYRKNGRDDRAEVEEAEIAVIERFLPAQMSDAEAAGRDPRDRRRNRRLVDEGHGPGDGAGEGAPRRRRSSRRGPAAWSRPRCPELRRRKRPRRGDAAEPGMRGSMLILRRRPPCRRRRRAVARHAVHHQPVKDDGERALRTRRPCRAGDWPSPR